MLLVYTRINIENVKNVNLNLESYLAYSALKGYYCFIHCENYYLKYLKLYFYEFGMKRQVK